MQRRYGVRKSGKQVRGDSMPTSSIFHNFVIENAEDAERFILAMEESEYDGHIRHKAPSDFVTDQDEIKELISKWKQNNDQNTFT